jgi:hypothetical protein
LDFANRRVLGVRLPILIYITFFVVVGVLVVVGQFVIGSGGSGTVLLEDDFSEPSAAWPAGAAEGGFTSFSNGEYQIGVDPDGSITAVRDLEADEPDVRVAADVVRRPEAGSVLFGVACRVRSGNRFDEFVISTSGQWAIVHSPDHGVLGQGSFDASLLGTGPILLEATCARDESGGVTRLALSVNGTIVGRGRDAGGEAIDESPGGVGMVVENGSGDPADVHFDDFRVTVA